MPFKSFLRNALAAGCCASGMLALVEHRCFRRLTILSYHRVLPADRRAACLYPDLAVTPESFRAHCRLLKRRFEVMPLTQAFRAMEDHDQNDRPLAAITFDDGYRDNYEYAAPILAEYNLPATFFVIADLLGSDRPPWYDRLARAIRCGGGQRPENFSFLLPAFDGDPGRGDDRRLVRWWVERAKRLGPGQRRQLLECLEAEANLDPPNGQDDRLMDWVQIHRLTRMGHEIGSHTRNHEILTQLDDAALEQEVAGSRRMLESRLGHSVNAFCYPNGDTDQRVVQAVAAAGYRSAVTVTPGSNRAGHDPFRLRRRFIHEERLTAVNGRCSPLLLRLELCGLADRVFRRRACQSPAPGEDSAEADA